MLLCKGHYNFPKRLWTLIRNLNSLKYLFVRRPPRRGSNPFEGDICQGHKFQNLLLSGNKNY